MREVLTVPNIGGGVLVTGAGALRAGAGPGGAGAQAGVCVRGLPRAGAGRRARELAAVSAGQGTETGKYFNWLL